MGTTVVADERASKASAALKDRLLKIRDVTLVNGVDLRVMSDLRTTVVADERASKASAVLKDRLLKIRDVTLVNGVDLIAPSDLRTTVVVDERAIKASAVLRDRLLKNQGPHPSQQSRSESDERSGDDRCSG